MIKTEMSPYIYTAVFILKHFINYLSKDHFAILILLYLSSVYPNQKKEADCTLFRISSDKTLNCSFHRNTSQVSQFLYQTCSQTFSFT